MTTVIDAYEHAAHAGRPVVICDFSPPRSGDPAFVDRVAGVPADFISVAYNPGRLPRADSIAAAHVIEQRTGKQAVFSLAPRDMNTIALQSQLLGAAMLGLENAVLLGGDDLGERERTLGVRQVRDLTTTALIASATAMNAGLDYRGAALQAPTALCIGGAVDPAKEPAREARLAAAKVRAGAQFLLTQPVYEAAQREAFLAAYESAAGGPLRVPVFWGVQVLSGGGPVFGSVPAGVRADLERGRSGAAIAVEVIEAIVADGARGVYLVPPVLRGGARDYPAAAAVLDALGA